MKTQHGVLKDAEEKRPRGQCLCTVQTTEEPGWLGELVCGTDVSFRHSPTPGSPKFKTEELWPSNWHQPLERHPPDHAAVW